MSTQFRPDSTTSLSQDGMDGISSGIASSGPQISMTTDPIASQTFPLGFLGSANHIDRLEGLYRMEIFYEKRQRQLAAMITPPVGPLSSPVSARNGSPFWDRFGPKLQAVVAQRLQLRTSRGLRSATLSRQFLRPRSRTRFNLQPYPRMVKNSSIDQKNVSHIPIQSVRHGPACLHRPFC